MHRLTTDYAKNYIVIGQLLFKLFMFFCETQCSSEELRHYSLQEQNTSTMEHTQSHREIDRHTCDRQTAVLFQLRKSFKF